MGGTALNERMGFTDETPNELVDKIWRSYTKSLFSHRGNKFEDSFTIQTDGVNGLPEELTFVVEKGKTGDYYKAAVFEDYSIHLNVDELQKVSDEKAKSSIAHELTHMGQFGKFERGERKEGEYGYNKAVNQGYIDESQFRYSMWMMEQLQEVEIEARLSQVYYYTKQSMKDVTPKGNMNTYVSEIVDNLEELTMLKDLQTAINRAQGIADSNNLYYLRLFVKDAQAALYGTKNGKQLDLPTAKKNASKIMELYKKRFERYRRRVYNAVYQGIQDTQER